MAEKGAHLTANQQAKPSIFELVAADSLNSTFYPAIKYIVNFIVTKNPEKYSFLLKYYDEFYLVFNGIVQNYYLHYHNGSLSEVFYGLSRFSPKTGKFNRRDHFASFACLVILPYFKNKLTNYLQQENDNNSSSKSYKIIKKANEILTSFYELAKLFQYILYISNKSQSYSPIVKLISLGLQYQPQQDDNEWTWSDLIYGKIKLAHVMSSVLFRGLELSAFFLQFLQWWQNESHEKSVGVLPIPPVPDTGYNGDRYLGLCPICFHSWSMPTVISISGFVYCYKCIVNHFSNNGNKCPVTNLPATIDDLIRIYDN